MLTQRCKDQRLLATVDGGFSSPTTRGSRFFAVLTCCVLLGAGHAVQKVVFQSSSFRGTTVLERLRLVISADEEARPGEPSPPYVLATGFFSARKDCASG